jgi:hypothetical protein
LSPINQVLGSDDETRAVADVARGLTGDREA